MSPKAHKLLSVLLLLLLVANYLPLVAGAAYAVAESLSKPVKPRQLSYPIAIIGDYDNDIATFLQNNGYSSSEIMSFDTLSDFMTSLGNGQLFSLVIANRFTDEPSSTEVSDFAKALDLRDIPLLVLDSWGNSYYFAGYCFYYAKDSLAAEGYPAPADRSYGYNSDETAVVIDILNTSHPIFSGVSNPFQESQSTEADYAYYSSFAGATVTELAHIVDNGNDVGAGIVEWKAPGGESWIFMSYGATKWQSYTGVTYYGEFSNDQKQVFLNTVSYLIGTGNPHLPSKGVVYGYVTDAVTGSPIANATVTAGTVTNTTNATGYYELHLDPGTYTVTVSCEPIYVAANFTVTITGGDTHEVNVTLDRKPVIRGYVFDAETGAPLANARVYTNVSGYENYTDSSGHYVLRVDPGTYKFLVEHEPFHHVAGFVLTVSANNVYEHNVTLSLKPKANVIIALVGDYPEHSGDGPDLYEFLRQDYAVIYYRDFNEFYSHISDYEWSVVILNWLGSSDPSITDFINALNYLNAMNIPIIILDTWYLGRPAGYYMYRHSTDIANAGYVAPSGRSESSSSSTRQIDIINTTHPIFSGVNDPYNITDYTTTYYAYYTEFTSPVYILANLTDGTSSLGIAIAEWKAPGNESWIFISYATNVKHHYNLTGSYGYFTEDAKKVLLNAIDYANKTHVPPPRVKIYGYVYDESMSPVSGVRVWIEGTGYVNYTDSTGYYELNNVFGNADYTMKAAKIGYYIGTRIVSVGDTDMQVDFVLHTKPPSIVIVGDHDTSSGKKDLNITLSQWWNIQEAGDYRELWDIINYEGQVLAVIFNAWTSDYSSPASSDIITTLDLLKNHSIPAIFLAGYGYDSAHYHTEYYGVYPLYAHDSSIEAAGYPAPDNTDYWSYADADKLWVNMTNPGLVFFKNIAPDADNAFHIHADLTGYGPYRGYNFTDDTVRVVAWFTDLDDNQVWGGIVTWNTSDGTRWIYMIGASTSYVRYTESGKRNQYNYKMILLLNNTINYVLGLTPPTLTGKLEGTVTDQNGNPVANAMVEIIELGLTNYTDSSGHYLLTNIPAGTYTLKVTAKGFYPYTTSITIGSGVNTYDVMLQKAKYIVAVIGDKEADITNYLWENQSIYAVHYDDLKEFLTDLCSGNYSFGVVVIDKWGSSLTSDDIISALRILDAYNLPIIFLDTYTSYTLTGVYTLYKYRDDIRAAGYPAPIYRGYHYTDYLYITINDSTHPLFSGITPDFDNAFYVEDDPSSSSDGAFWHFDPADNVTVLGYLGDTDDYGIMDAAVAEWTAPGGEAWIFLGAASTLWMKYSAPGTDGRYSAKAWMLLVNAIRYANATRGVAPTKVVYQLTIKDIITGSPVENAKVYVNETGDIFYSTANGSATVILPLRCSNYTLIISKSGYVSRILSLSGLENYTVTIYLAEYGNGTITGYVYDADTGSPISGAIVYIPGVNSTTTAADGSFSLKVPSGAYTLYVKAPLYLEANVSVIVPANDTVSVTVYLEKQPPTVLVVGDYYGDVAALLKSLGYHVDTAANWSEMLDMLPWGNYIAVVINGWGNTEPSAENVTHVLTVLDSMDIPVIFLDGNVYSDEYFGVSVLYTYKDEVTALGYPAPETRSDTFSDYGYVYILMLYPDHPLFSGITPDNDSMFLIGTGTGHYKDNDYAYYTFSPMTNLMILGNIYDTQDNRNATTIAVWISPGGARWVFLGASASGYWMRYTEPGRDDQYSTNAAKLLANAIDYAITYNTTPSVTLTVSVYDKLDETPISGANVTVVDAGVTGFTNASGVAVITAPVAGYITVSISKPGYINTTITIHAPDIPGTGSATVYLKPYGNGTITGYVYDAETSKPLAGVNVSVQGIAWALTDSNGRYVISVPADIYTWIAATKINYYDKNISVNIVLHPGDVVTQNITMEKKPPAVILVSTDYYASYAEDMKSFIESLGYYVEWYSDMASAATVINAGRETYVVVLGELYKPTASDLLSFVQLLDEKNISLIILDTWGSSYYYNAGYYFYSYRSALRSYGYIAPATRTYHYPRPKYVTLRIEKELYGFTYDIGFTEYSGVTNDSRYFDYAVYTFEPTDLVDVVVTLHDTDNNVDGVAVAVWYPSGGERWIFISYGASHWIKYMEMGSEGQFSDEAKLVFARAINYALMRGTKIEVENFTVTVPRENGVVMPGDKIRITGRVYYWIGNNKYPLANETLKVYMLSTPYVIGSVTTGPDGSFDTTITVPNSTPTGEHAIGLGGASYTIYVLSPPGQPGANRYLFLPAPEPQLLPLLLLAALLLIVMFKKRR